MFAWACFTVEAAVPLMGLEIRPLGRADLVWVDEARTTGVLVGEHDGVVSPPVAAFGGARLGERWVLTGGLGVAWLENLTTAGDVTTRRWWAVFRPSADLRANLLVRRPQRPVPYLLLGAHGDIPTVGDVSNGYTDEEQAAIDEATATERARLAGVGGRGGVGVELRVLPAFDIGFLYAVEGHRSLWQADDVGLATVWVAGEAALTLTWSFEPKAEAPATP